jgi:hypothetical protein
LKRQKKEAAEELELKQKQKMMLKEKDKDDNDDEDIHIEGDTDVEEFYEGEEDSEQDEGEDEAEVAKVDFTAEKKKAMRPGPTTRSHHEDKFAEPDYFVPLGGEDCHSDELDGSDDDGWVKKFVLPSGKWRRQVKMKKRIWYDEARPSLLKLRVQLPSRVSRLRFVTVRVKRRCPPQDQDLPQDQDTRWLSIHACLACRRARCASDPPS